jgi:ATP-dependent DNA helicase RecG
MVQTTDGFVIAEVDLRLRGPGNIEGTQQSGMLRFLLADLARDAQIIAATRDIATQILEKDPRLELPEHGRLRQHLAAQGKDARIWSRIS